MSVAQRTADVPAEHSAAGTSGLQYYALTPCRVADTRDLGGMSGPAGPPFLAAKSARSFLDCRVRAVSQWLTVVQSRFRHPLFEDPIYYAPIMNDEIPSCDQACRADPLILRGKERDLEVSLKVFVQVTQRAARKFMYAALNQSIDQFAY